MGAPNRPSAALAAECLPSVFPRTALSTLVGQGVALSRSQDCGGRRLTTTSTVLRDGELFDRTRSDLHAEPHLIESEPSHCVANVKGSQRKLLGGVQLDLSSTRFRSFRQSSRYHDYTVVVAALRNTKLTEHWSFDKFRSRAEQRFAKAVSLRKRGVHVVWYLAPFYPHTTNGFPVVVKDWRTDARIRLFNNYAKQRCLTLGIPVVDPMSISSAFMHTSPDQAHFTNFVATEFVAAVWTVICAQFDDCRKVMES